MWYRGDGEDGYESNKTGSSGGGSPGWLPGPESAWLNNPPGARAGRRHSAVSDSGDTGIGTCYSDSVEDDSSSSTTPLSFLPLSQHLFVQDDDGGVPSVHARPSPSSSPGAGSGRWSRSCQLLSPGAPRPGPHPGPHPGCPDVRDQRPVRRWSSLTKLSGGQDKTSGRTPGSQGSLDRGLLPGGRKEPDLYLPLTSPLLAHSLPQRSPGAAPCYRRGPGGGSLSSALSSPARQHGSLDAGYGSPEEARPGGARGTGSPHQADRGSPIQPAVRTQMWLTEQMEYRPRAEGGDGPSPWQRAHQPQQEPGLNQMAAGTSLPVNTLVKVKEGLLRQRELEIDRQKQQILQLHARIRENELRAQQVLQSQRGWLDEPRPPSAKEPAARAPRRPPSDRLCCGEELGRKLAVAELEVLHLNELFKQVAHKYTEDVRRLEDKIKTRDRYISSLKKKCQRESEQSREKQQRIETLEKYLSDLPTLDEVQAQAQQQEEVQQKAQDLEKTVCRLHRSLEEGCALMKDRDAKLEMQARRERELMASVHSLQQKVQQCLDDGVRLPMQDLKRLEVENTQLLEQRDHSSRLIEHQREQIERLTSQLTATSARLQKKRGLSLRQQSHQDQSLTTPSRAFPQKPPPRVEMPEVGRLLKEMSLCLLDLQALCSILAQRAQGKEPNLSLLLGMKSLSVSAEESEGGAVAAGEEELRFRLLEVGQLRRDIDELRRSISDRYAQYMGDSCVSQ